MTDNSIPEKTPRQEALDQIFQWYNKERHNMETQYRRSLADIREESDRQLAEIDKQYPDEAAR